MNELCGAVKYLHERNIIHRDVKLENVLYNGGDIKLIDFGFAMVLESEDETLNDFCGTPSYMSPEML